MALQKWDLAVSEGKSAVEPLIMALQTMPISALGEVADALGQIGDVRAIKPLIETLDNGSMTANAVRAVAQALEKIGKPVVKQLIATLSEPHSNSFDYSLIISVLGNIGDTRAVKPLIDELRHNWNERQQAIIVALGKIGDPRAVRPLTEVLKNSIYPEARDYASKALEHISKSPKSQKPKTAGKARGSRAVNTLITELYKSQENVRRVLNNIKGAPVWGSYNTQGNTEQRAIALREADNTASVTSAAVSNIVFRLETKLNSSISSLNSTQLSTLAKLDDASYIYKDWDDIYTRTKGIIDCSQIRQLARQELKRRSKKA